MPRRSIARSACALALASPWACVSALAITACGGGHASPDAVTDTAGAGDAAACQPIGAIGSFYRRPVNPRIIAGHATFTDGEIDLGVDDPDLRWDDASASWQLYYATAHAMTFASAAIPIIRHASSPDLATWTIDDAPALSAPTDTAAWDHTNTETPTVAVNPDATPDHRYLMLYSGANGAFPFAGYAFANYAIGAAWSADGRTFTRISAAESPHAKDGLALIATDLYPTATGGILADPELAYVNGVYHLWLSSFSCIGATCATTASYGVAHATSTDGIHWTPAEAPVRSLLRASADPKSGGSQPSVIYDAIHCRWELWLHSDLAGETDAQPIVFNNMAGVWHATSADAVTWTINYNGARDLDWMASSPGEHLGLLTGADVAANSTGRYMLYSGFDDQNVPSGFFLFDRSMAGFEPGVITLNLATRDAP